MSHRRAAQLGIVAAAMLFAACVGVLFSQGSDGGASPANYSNAVAPDSATIKTAPISLSTLSAPAPIHSNSAQR